MRPPPDQDPLLAALIDALGSLPPERRDHLLSRLPGPVATRARAALLPPVPVLGTLDTLATPPDPYRSAASAERDREAGGPPPPAQGALDSHEPQLYSLPRLAGLHVPDPREPDHPDGLDGYERLGLLGRGGMGEVLEVRDPILDRPVALKHIDDRRIGPEATLRFIEEARLTAQLQHPGIVPVHTVGRLDAHRLYYTMQRIRGRTLSEHIRALHGALIDGLKPPTLHRLIGWFHAACEAIAYAHSRQVIHRDLKPDNIMIGAFGEVLVMDWGIAKPLSQLIPTDEDATLIDPEPIIRRRSLETGSPLETRTGDAVGTPMYMPPEQARGDLARLSPASDVYALGAVLYQILCGHFPFEGTQPLAVMMQVILGRRRPLAGDLPIPATLGTICDRAMSPEPDHRYPHAGALAEAIAEWLEGARKRSDALRLVADADALLPQIAAHHETAEAARRSAAALLATLPLAAPVTDKRAAWHEADRATAAEQAAAQAEVAREEALRAALSHVPDLPEAHLRLARLYLERHGAAEARRDLAETIRYEALIRSHTEALPATAPQRAEYTDYLAGQGRLTLHCAAPRAVARLFRYETLDRRLRPRPIATLDPLPLEHHPLPRGSYLIELEAAGHACIRYPVRIDRRRHWDGRPPGQAAASPIELPASGALPDDQILIPAGPAWLGGDPQALDGRPHETPWLTSYIIQRDPVTNGAYLRFIHALVRQGREQDAIRWAPRTATDDPDATYTWNPDLPVVMIDSDCAIAYATWLRDQTGHPWRLPTEAEWEKAARGVDGRYFPWGDHLDPSWCRMRDSAPEDSPLAPVDAYPVDTSPYGVRGLAGNIREWTCDPFKPGAPANAPRVARGGSHQDAEAGCRAASRYRAPHEHRALWLGFRLVRSVSAPDDEPGADDHEPGTGDDPYRAPPRSPRDR